MLGLWVGVDRGQYETRDKHVCKIFVDGRACMRCTLIIDLGYLQVVLKVNTTIPNRDSIMKYIVATMIIIHFNLKLRK